MALIGLSFAFLWVVAVISTFVWLVRGFVLQIGLSKYLKREHYSSWRDITTVGSFGPGGANPFRYYRYLKSDRDNDDERVLRYKDRLRAALRFAFFSGIVFVIGIVIVFVLTVVITRQP